MAGLKFIWVFLSKKEIDFAHILFTREKFVSFPRLLLLFMTVFYLMNWSLVEFCNKDLK